MFIFNIRLAIGDDQLTIGPKQLVNLVEKQGLSCIVLDFRDQRSQLIKFNRILSIEIPTASLQPGLVKSLFLF